MWSAGSGNSDPLNQVIQELLRIWLRWFWRVAHGASSVLGWWWLEAGQEALKAKMVMMDMTMVV